jgi:rhodanese-related sulfurtransferase
MPATISKEELKAKLDRGDKLTIVEVLPAQYYRHTHLPGAINLPPEEFGKLAPQLLPDKSAAIVVYCADVDCKLAPEAAAELEAQGYTDVSEYPGGKADWVEAGLPTEGAARVHKQAQNTTSAR